MLRRPASRAALIEASNEVDESRVELSAAPRQQLLTLCEAAAGRKKQTGSVLDLRLAPVRLVRFDPGPRPEILAIRCDLQTSAFPMRQ